MSMCYEHFILDLVSVVLVDSYILLTPSPTGPSNLLLRLRTVLMREWRSGECGPWQTSAACTVSYILQQGCIQTRRSLGGSVVEQS